ncbi:MAG TPA: AAA family ATPase [Bacteroidales bacterium]|nr:AAA family ATPase [Bacteroidales bacterium]
MIYYRKLYRQLLDWKNSSNHKPLIIRGARQVGKSTLIKEFGKEFKYFINLNLEKQKDKNIFDKLDSASDIINALFIGKGVPYSDAPTLVFFDEIQESPRAIKMLRYFYEEYPDLYFIAAGSLLEFALKKVPSFPVGRVKQLVLYPFDFEEFLLALNRKDLIGELEKIPVAKYAHDPILDLFHDYAIIGGMPEVISRYAEEKNMMNLGEIYENLWQSYRDDVEKYASNSTERKIIRHIIATAPFEKDRITQTGFGNSNYRSREVGEALRSLDMARIIQLIYPATSTEPPAIPNLRRKPRLQFIDTGLLNYSLGNQAEMIGLNDLNGYHRGRIIQHLAAQQLLAQNSSPLYKSLFWVREKVNSNAEVGLLHQYKKYLIPIEIKSGGHGTIRSLHQFLEEANHKFGIRLLANYFSVESVKTPGGIPYLLMNLPYYASYRIPQYVEWFVENNKKP